jgi:hypothetical protein
MTPIQKPPFQIWIRRSPAGRDRYSVRLQAVTGRWSLTLDAKQVLRGSDAHAEGLSAKQLRLAQVVPAEGQGIAYALASVTDELLASVGVRDWAELGVAQLSRAEVTAAPESVASPQTGTQPVAQTGPRERNPSRAFAKASAGQVSKSFTIVKDADDDAGALLAPMPHGLYESPTDKKPVVPAEPAAKSLSEREAEFVRRHAPDLTSDFDAPSGPVELKQDRIAQSSLTWPDSSRPVPKKADASRALRPAPVPKPAAVLEAAPAPSAPAATSSPGPAAIETAAASSPGPAAGETAATSSPGPVAREPVTPQGAAPAPGPVPRTGPRPALLGVGSDRAVPTPPSCQRLALSPTSVDPPGTLRALRRQALHFDVERAVLEARVAELEAALARSQRPSRS